MVYKKEHAKIVEVCLTALTFTEVEARLGQSTPSTSLRRYIRQHNIPMPMYEGRRVAYKTSHKTRRNLTSELDLCENSLRTTGCVKDFLIRKKIKEEKCEKCGWCEKRPSDGKIPIHLHHKNGDSTDNRLVNLEFLCPNCHSLTDNYAGKNQRSKRREEERKTRALYYAAPKYICETCGKLGYGEKYCSLKCSHEAIRKVKWPTKEQLANEIKMMSWTAIGRKYGVSDNAVRKWAKYYEIL